MTRLIPGARDARRLATPRSAALQARDNPAPTILLIFAALVGIQGLRDLQAGRPALPTAHQAAAYAVAAIAFVLFATVAPDLVTYSLLLVLLFVFLTNAALVESSIARFTQQLGRTTAAGGAR